MRDAGWYRLFDGRQQLAEYAFNYDRKESDLRYKVMNRLHAGCPAT
ncbi:MAG: hypothetical protein IPJ82_23050 [Lewinellaceae bacterium]|nr:hypothetical protein [Lewinellaceae bacterium]